MIGEDESIIADLREGALRRANATAAPSGEARRAGIFRSGH